MNYSGRLKNTLSEVITLKPNDCDRLKQIRIPIIKREIIKHNSLYSRFLLKIYLNVRHYFFTGEKECIRKVSRIIL
jgi:hypothetical protein